jgi:hypothetical protein
VGGLRPRCGARIEDVAKDLLRFPRARNSPNESAIAALAGAVVTEYCVQATYQLELLSRRQTVDVGQIADRAKLDLSVLAFIGREIRELKRNRLGGVGRLGEYVHHLATSGIVKRASDNSSQQVALPER